MRRLGKTLAVAATVIGVAGAGLAVAQPFGPGGYGPMGYGSGFMHGPGMMGGWGGARLNPAARLEALKTELSIRPEQQGAWDGFAKALEDSAAQMQAVHAQMFQSMTSGDTWQQHQALMAKLFDQRAEVFKTMQDAAAKLMAVLDDGQKSRLVLPALIGGGPGVGGAGPGMMGWGGGPGMMGWGGPGWGPGSGAR